MTTDHAAPDAFQKLLHGDSSSEETRQIVRHLIGGCGHCLQHSALARTAAVETVEWQQYDDPLDRVERWLDGRLMHEPEPQQRPRAVAAHL